MQLRSPDGASVDLRITDSQWDPFGSWLQVCGHITLADGKTWAFENPCLTTRDARELESWLREVAAGTVPPSPVIDGEPEELLEFLEPNLAFSVEGRTADRVQIRVHLGAEARPPWLRGTEEEFVRLDVSAEELTGAAESWMVGLAEFPER